MKGGERQDTQGTGGSQGPPGVPNWVKASGIVIAILVLVLLLLAILTGGNHGPNRHQPDSALEPHLDSTATADPQHEGWTGR